MERGLRGELVDIRVACFFEVAVRICVGIGIWLVSEVDVRVLLHVDVAALVAGGANRVDGGVHECNVVVVGASGRHESVVVHRGAGDVGDGDDEGEKEEGDGDGDGGRMFYERLSRQGTVGHWPGVGGPRVRTPCLQL